MRMSRIYLFIFIGLLATVLLIYNSSLIERSLRINHVRNYQTRKDGVKYILMWTHNYTEPFNRFKNGRTSFREANCPINNCYVTNNRNYLENVEDWDAILFHAPEYTWRKNPWRHGTPSARSPHQRYIFVSIESAANYPVEDQKWNGYFNWTMTYKTDSDIPWIYLAIRDIDGNLVGPRENIEWNVGEDEIPQHIKDSVDKKCKAVAWFVSNRETLSKRENYAEDLQAHLEKLGLTLDKYGRYEKLKCPIDDKSACWKLLKDDYFFYLSFENSFSEDYTTEKLLNAVLNDAVPIVLGGSNYSKFLPPNSYLNANSYSPEKLAQIINDLMQNKEEYKKFFKWTNYYRYSSYDESPETHQACLLCEALNKTLPTKTYNNFIQWWNGKK